MTSLDPPPGLNDEGRQIWRETVEQILAAGTRARIDENFLLAYVESVRENRRAVTLINQTDLLVNQGGKPVPNPLLDIHRQTARLIAEFGKQFNLNHISHTEVSPEGRRPPVGQEGQWCDQHHRWECRARRSGEHLGEQCHANAVIGLGKCKKHAGVNIETSAKHLLALEQRRNPLFGQPLDINPADAFLDRIRVLAGEIARIDVYLAGLDGTEMTKVREVRGPDGTREVWDTELAVWGARREREERALHSACESALKSNIEERLVRVAERQGAVIYRLITTVLGDLGISADDPRVAEVVPRRLRELTA